MDAADFLKFYQELMVLKTSPKIDSYSACTMQSSFHATEQGSGKLSSLPLTLPAFDFIECPQVTQICIPAPYEGSEFSLDKFMLQCEFNFWKPGGP